MRLSRQTSRAGSTIRFVASAIESEMARSSPTLAMPRWLDTIRLENETMVVSAENSTARGVDVQAYLKAWLATVKVPAAIRVAVDVDPVSFF